MVIWGVFFLYLVGAQETAVRLLPHVDPLKFAEDNRLVYLGPVANLSNYYLFELDVTSTHPSESEEVTWYQEQSRRQLAPRSTPHDPDYPKQWHLHDPLVGLNVPPAWRRGYTGHGITIGILDDGVEADHPDLKANYNPILSYDVNSKCKIPVLALLDTHGTAAAGLAAGASNWICGLGVSYRASIAGIRMIATTTNDAEEAQGISYGAPLVDIYTASWGPVDDGKRLEAPGHLAQETLEAVVNGHPSHPHLHARERRGAIYIWAGGNGKAYGDNCNYDGWANSRFTITVAAVDDNGEPTFYGEKCSAILTTAPSSGGKRKISTTDRTGSAGYSPGNCNDNFGGTSAVSPMIAGLVALVLESNPNLTWRDVQHILVESSEPIPKYPGQLNKAGHYYSHDFGFGLANAEAAVLVALDYKKRKYTSPEVVTYEYHQTVNASFEGGLIQSINVTEDIQLEHVEVVFDAQHPQRGLLNIYLIGPDEGVISILAEEHQDRHADYTEWRLMTLAHWGERSRGVWTLTVSNADEGVWNYWRLRLWGSFMD